jgi:hypothetical protein
VPLVICSGRERENIDLVFGGMLKEAVGWWRSAPGSRPCTDSTDSHIHFETKSPLE